MLTAQQTRVAPAQTPVAPAQTDVTAYQTSDITTILT